MKADADALGSYLFSKGFKDCHIALMGENSYEWILTHFSVTCSGNVIVPIDKDLDASGVSELLADSHSVMLVYSDSYKDIAEKLIAQLPGITYLNMKDMPLCLEEGSKLISEGYTECVDKKVDKDDLASIVYTSGTTGKSKGVMLTHGNFARDAYSACCNVKVSGNSILMLPLHHTFGLVAGVFSIMMYGCPIYINSSLKRLMMDFEKAKPQHFFAVPLIVETLYKTIWSTAKKNGKDKKLRTAIRLSNALRKLGTDLRRKLMKPVLSALGGNLEVIICGGAPLNPQLVRDYDSIGITLLNGYGITECSPIVAVNRNKFNVVGSVGLPLLCNQVKISEDGEVLVKGENVMLGYYNMEEENANVFADGWFRTGDLGRIDEYGALHITGRIKNLIILGNGENIPAESIEQEIYKIPYVKECIAYGKDDVIVAEVYLDEEVPDAKDRINGDIEFMNQRMPRIRNVGKVVVRDTEFPKTTTKKIKRNCGGF